MDWGTVEPIGGILATLFCCPAPHPTLNHHVSLAQVHRRGGRTAIYAVEEWMSRLVAPHLTPFPPTHHPSFSTQQSVVPPPSGSKG